MLKKHFSLFEVMVGLSILVICLDLVATAVLQSQKYHSHNQSTFIASIVTENVLEELDPTKFTREDLDKVMIDESIRNEFEKNGIFWEIKQTGKTIKLYIFSKEGGALNTKLELP